MHFLSASTWSTCQILVCFTAICQAAALTDSGSSSLGFSLCLSFRVSAEHSTILLLPPCGSLCVTPLSLHLPLLGCLICRVTPLISHPHSPCLSPFLSLVSLSLLFSFAHSALFSLLPSPQPAGPSGWLGEGESVCSGGEARPSVYLLCHKELGRIAVWVPLGHNSGSRFPPPLPSSWGS